MSTATDKAAMLSAICDDPHDTGLRLIYADWLEEHGEAARAEFIRVQCELEDLRCTCTCEYEHGIGCPASRETALRRRERELQAPGIRWWSDYGPGDKIHILKWRRGFVEVVSCVLRDWFMHGPKLVRCQPILEVQIAGRKREGGSFLYTRYETVSMVEWARRDHDHLGLKAMPALRAPRA